MRALTGLLALAILLLLLGAAQGWAVLSTLGYSLLITIVLSYLWAWAGVRWLYVRPRSASLRAQVGTHLSERSELENLSWLPKTWLELIDAADHPEHNLSQILALGPVERRIRIVRTLCRQRGEFKLGPLWVASGDPFGLFRRERLVTGPTRLVVLPATVDLPRAGQLPGELPGGSLRGERVHFTTPNVATVRQYLPGDSMNRVHWLTTARLGQLMVREFERDPYADIWIVLDLDRLVQVGNGPNSTEEYAVTVGASLGRHYLLQDRAVGVLSQTQRLPTDRGPRQLIRLLEFLAVVRSSSQQSLEALLLAETQRLGRRDNLVVITPSVDSRWVAVCRDLARRGIPSSVVLIRPGSFGPAPSENALLGELAALGAPTYLVELGANLASALASPVLGRSG